MKIRNNVTNFSSKTQGLLFGTLGVLTFSFTLPATRVAVHDLDGTVVGLGRALVAAALAAVLLVYKQEKLPARRYWWRLAVVASGVVVGFPLFSALALRDVSSAHAAVITGLLPAATAAMAVVRAGERPSGRFWVACTAGTVAVFFFASVEGAGMPRVGDLFALLAVLLGSLGYAEGGALSRELGGWRVICWALVFAAPFVSLVVLVQAVGSGLAAGPAAWLGFAYVSIFSMFLGFFAWYRGLAVGGVARVSQLQLAQPLLTLAWSAALLGERVGITTILAALFILASVAASQRARIERAATRPPGADGRRIGAEEKELG